MRPCRFFFRTASVLISAFFLLSAAVAQQLPSSALAANSPRATPPAEPAPAAVPQTAHTYAPAPDPLFPSAVKVTPEDWTQLELDPSNFFLLEPVVGAEGGNDKFDRELVQLKWRVGDPVELYIVRPKGVAKPPVVLYLYGYKDNLDRFTNDHFCELLTKGGYAAVGFEPALGIDRFRSGRPMKEWFVSELQESLGSSVHDVQLVLNYLESRKDLDLNHAGIFGQGSSGPIAILSAATDPRMKAVDTLNPWGDWSDWFAKSAVIPEAERPAYLKPEFLEKVKPLEPSDWLPKVKASSVRLQFVTGSPAVPESSMQHMEAAAAHDTGTVHFTAVRYKDTQDLIQQTDGGRLFDWIKDRLRTVSGSTSPDAFLPGKSSTKPSEKAELVR